MDKVQCRVISRKMQEILPNLARVCVALLSTCSQKFKMLGHFLIAHCSNMSHCSKADVRRMIKNFEDKNPSVPKSAVVRRFSDIGVPRSTVYNVFKNFEARGHVENISQGRKPSKMTSISKTKLVRSCKGRIGVSQRILSRNYGIAQSYVCKILKRQA